MGRAGLPNNPMGRVMGKRHVNAIRFTTAPGAGNSIHPTITLRAGCPYTPVWDWGDGTAQSTGSAPAAHTYTAAGTRTVTITLPRADYWLRGINAASCYVTGDFMASLRGCNALANITANTNAGLNSHYALSQLPAGMTTLYLYNTASVITGALADLPAGMTYLNLYNTASVITGALADLPAGMTYLNLGNTASVITGALADLPAGMTYLNLGNAASVVTGALADLPAGMTQLYLYNTASVITGGGTAVPAHAIGTIDVSNTHMLQAAVDGIVNRLYADRASFTAAAPALAIGGTNQAPSGVYQSVTPPTSGKEAIYDLVNDPTAQGFKKWTVTYTI